MITALEKPRYFDALQEADRGALRTFVQMLETKPTEALRYATRSIENILEGRHSYFHMNGDRSTRSPENGWTRHRGTNGRESVIDAAEAARRARLSCAVSSSPWGLRGTARPTWRGEAVLHQRHRASSAIEGFNATLRPYLYVHKGATKRARAASGTQGFLALFCAWFNLRTRRWGRHKGTSAHECLTGQRVYDWLTLLGYPPSPTLH